MTVGGYIEHSADNTAYAYKVCRQSRMEDVGALKAVSGQRQEHAEVVLQLVQEMRSTNVREEAQGSLGHRQKSAFRRHSELPVDRKTAALKGDEARKIRTRRRSVPRPL